MSRHIVEYPSGKRFELSGKLFTGILPELDPKLGVNAGIEVEGSRDIVMLDPRARVSDAAGVQEYGPRDYPLDLFAAGILEWLVENPDWDAR